MTKENILVVGGTGKTGRRVVRLLTAMGRPVRSAARTGGDVSFDLGDRATFGPVLDDITAVYLLVPTGQMGPDGLAAIRDFVTQAVATDACPS